MFYLKPRCYGRKYKGKKGGCKYPIQKHTVYSGTFQYMARRCLRILMYTLKMTYILSLHT